MKKIKLSIIIISTNEAHYLDNCLSSIYSNFANFDSFEIILINNNSTDNTNDLVEKKYKKVKLHKRRKTFGFAANNNFGIKNSLGEYFLLLNADTICKKGSIQKLLDFMDKNKNRVGICGPRMVYPDGNLQLSCREFPTIWSGIIRRSPLRIFFPVKTRGLKSIDTLKPKKVDWLLGACLLINKKMINQIGLLDEKFFLYVEDIDIAWRTWLAGWEIYYLPASIIIHYHQAKSDKKFFSFHSKHHLNSIVHFLLKHKYFLKKNFYWPNSRL